MRALSLDRKSLGADAGVDWPGIFRSLVLAFAMTAAPIFLHIVSQPVALAFCLIMSCLLAYCFEQDVPMVIFVANVFQNIFASLISPYFVDYSDIEILKSYSFLTTIACYLVVAWNYLTHTQEFSPFVRRMITVSFAVTIVVSVYFVLGLAINPRNATVYFRNIGLPILLFQTFLLVGARHRLPLPQITITLLALVGVCSYLELFWIDGWLRLTNGWTYLTLFSAKRLTNPVDIRTAMEKGVVVTNVLDYWRSTLLNTTLTSDFGFQVQRLIGPNFNTISIAYLLAIFIAFLLAHDAWIAALLAAPLLIATSAKGPIVLALGSGIFFYVARRSRSDLPIIGLGAGLAAYALLVFATGYQGGDYHVLGLIGGWNGFLALPIGHTLGDGGNLSIPDFSQLNWGDFQRAGAATVAVESAFGVLLYQLGIAAIAVIAFYFWIARISWRLYRATGAPALAFCTGSLSICLVNGLFQEEAYFVPLSLPFVMGLVGLSLGAADRAIAPVVREGAPRTCGERNAAQPLSKLTARAARG